jgi:methyltransferase-like protein
VLCKNNNASKINRNIAKEVMADLSYFPTNIFIDLPLEELEKHLIDKEEVVFLGGASKTSTLYIKTNDAIVKTVCSIFLKNHIVLSFDEIVAEASKIISTVPIQDIKDAVSNLLSMLVFGGYIRPYGYKYPMITDVSERPLASKLVRYQAQHNAKLGPVNWVSNLINKMVAISEADAFLIRYLDGKHDKASIKEKIFEHFEKKELVANFEGGPITDVTKQKEIASEFVEIGLKNLLKNMILIG